jgi:hypothetical protein
LRNSRLSGCFTQKEFGYVSSGHLKFKSNFRNFESAYLRCILRKCVGVGGTQEQIQHAIFGLHLRWFVQALQLLNRLGRLSPCRSLLVLNLALLDGRVEDGIVALFL